jgi:hypothetical protein
VREKQKKEAVIIRVKKETQDSEHFSQLLLPGYNLPTSSAIQEQEEQRAEGQWTPQDEERTRRLQMNCNSQYQNGKDRTTKE